MATLMGRFSTDTVFARPSLNRRSVPGRHHIVDRRTRAPEPQADEPQAAPDRLQPRRFSFQED